MQWSSRLDLTPLDRIALQWLIQCTMVFDRMLDADALRAGLTSVVEHIPMLSGRIVDRRAIAYPGDAIPFFGAHGAGSIRRRVRADVHGRGGVRGSALDSAHSARA